MQQAASRQPNPNFGANNKSNSRSTIIIILALLLFALSGLMTGFATGAFTRPKPTQHPQGNKGTKGALLATATPQQTSSPSTTSTPQVVKLGIPFVQELTSKEKADGTTNYTVTAYPVDKEHQSQVHFPDITCKLWLTKDKNATETLLAAPDKLTSLDTVSQVLPTEMDKALMFVGSTSQTQPCNANGLTTWTYTVSSTVKSGMYFIMVLTDWKGKAYNWRALEISVKKAED